MALSAPIVRLAALLLVALLMLSALPLLRAVGATRQPHRETTAPRLNQGASSHEPTTIAAPDRGPIYDAGQLTPRLAPPGAVSRSEQIVAASALSVTKTVSPTTAEPGETVTYTLTIASQDTLSHTVALTDVLPAGVTFVPGSLSGADASYDAASTTITVSASLLPTRAASYSYEDDLMAPGLAASSPLGGYVDFTAPPYNFPTLPRADDSALNFNIGCPFEFYGSTGGTANFLGYSTNGLFFPRGIPPANGGSSLATSLPAPTTPNGLIAGLWDSMSLTNTNTFTSSGRLPVTFNATCDQKITVLQLKDLHTRSDSDPTRNALDVELVYNHGQPEHYWVLYNNVRGPLSGGVVGLENQSGTLGLEYLKDGQPNSRQLTDARVIHYYRPLLTPAPLTISFQATVDPDAPSVVTNVAQYTIDGATEVQSTGASFSNPAAPTSTPTSTATPTDTPTNTPTSTPTSTPTNTPTSTPTLTASPTATATPTPTSTPTLTASSTATATPTPTVTSQPVRFLAFLPLIDGPGIPPRPIAP